MRKYRSIQLDYGVNTALIEAYREMRLEMEFEEESETNDEMEGVVPEMATTDNMESVEAYAVEDSFVNEVRTEE